MTCSWFGWSASKAPGALRETSSPFSRSFLVTLIDVLIVIQYFLIVRGIDVVYANGSPFSIAPSIKREAWGVSGVFLSYALWDWTVGQSARMSIVCAVLAGLTAAAGSALDIDTPLAAIAIDVSLIGVVLGFRALHEWWPPVDTRPQPDQEERSTPSAVRARGLRWTAACLLIWTVGIVIAWWLR